MSPEQQRIAIAKSCEYHEINDQNTSCRKIGLHGWTFIPDYLNDLNAMHEAESFIRNAQDQMRYASETLMAMGFDDLMEASDLNVDYCWHAMGATAPQRAKAFLKTLNLWKP